jgi:hypothetical protein
MIALFERRDIAERGWRQEEFDSKVTTWVKYFNQRKAHLHWSGACMQSLEPEA